MTETRPRQPARSGLRYKVAARIARRPDEEQATLTTLALLCSLVLTEQASRRELLPLLAVYMGILGITLAALLWLHPGNRGRALRSGSWFAVQWMAYPLIWILARDSWVAAAVGGVILGIIVYLSSRLVHIAFGRRRASSTVDAEDPRA